MAGGRKGVRPPVQFILQISTKAVFLSKDRTWTSQALFSFSELVISVGKRFHTHAHPSFPGHSSPIVPGITFIQAFSKSSLAQTVYGRVSWSFVGYISVDRESWPDRSDLQFHTLGFTPLHSQAALHFSLLCSFKLCKLWSEVWSQGARDLGAETRTCSPFFLQSIYPPISATGFYKKNG